MNKLLNDEELSKLDRYKSVNLIKAINECNTYVQNGAIITMLDIDKNDKLHIVNRSVGALYEVMNYINNESITREAIIEVIYNLFQTARSNKYPSNSLEFNQLSFAVNILQKILLENTLFKIFSCKKGFVPESPLNNTKDKIKRGDILYLLERSTYKNKSTGAIFDINIFFNVFSGNWNYISDNEMDYLKLEKVKYSEGNSIE